MERGIDMSCGNFLAIKVMDMGLTHGRYRNIKS